ncbi:MAG: glycosyltransferase family 4 protein, partial [Bauldia sp.]
WWIAAVMRRPRFAMIAPAMPASGGNGLAMRLGMFLEALASAGDTTLLVIPVAGPADVPPVLAERLGVAVQVIEISGRADTQFALLSRLAAPAARLAAFRAYGRPSLAAALSRPVLADIAALVTGGAFDLVHVGRLYLGEAALHHRGAKTIDIDDDDSFAYRSRGAVLRKQGNAAAADWAVAESQAFASLAQAILPAYDAVFSAGGAADAAVPAEAIQNAVTMPRDAAGGGDGRTIVFVGALGYDVNVDGILWFIRAVWPTVRRTSSVALHLLIVGRDAPQSLRAWDGRAGIAVLGAVDDLGMVYRRATLAIAPLRSGGGTRIKLIEAAVWRVPFVATPAAAAGLSIGNESCGWIADGAADFARAVTGALGDPGERRRRAARAYSRVRRDHDRPGIVAALAERFRAMATSTMVRARKGRNP